MSRTMQDINDVKQEGKPPSDGDGAADEPLAAGLHALRAGLALHNAPPGVQKELMAAFARQFPARRWYQRLSPGQWGLAGGTGAGIAAVLAGLAIVLGQQAPVELGGRNLPGAPAMLAFDERGDFLALASLERIEQESSPQMVETNVPRTELAMLGVPVNPENAGESVRAELMIGADGSALALRLSVP